jgi:hypothetical protein
MQFMVEQSRNDAPFTVLNLDAQRRHLARFKPYMSEGEINDAESLLQKKEAELSAFVKGVMHENVARYSGREVLLDAPGRWAEAILYFMDIFTSCESMLSRLINKSRMENASRTRTEIVARRALRRKFAPFLVERRPSASIRTGSPMRRGENKAFQAYGMTVASVFETSGRKNYTAYGKKTAKEKKTAAVWK